MSVAEVRTAVPAGTGVEAGLVVLADHDEPRRFLRIVIGQPEARAIDVAWRAATPDRPNTWDLFVTTIALLDGRITRAVISAVEQERHFYARVEVVRDGAAHAVACRPSDAVALALRSAGAELCADADVLDAAGVLADGSRPPPRPMPNTEGEEEPPAPPPPPLRL